MLHWAAHPFKMILFNSDLDNTIIYSYKHNIGSPKRCAEIYQGKEASFITEKTYQLLQKVRSRVLMIPTTTRTVEQYNRIDLGTGSFPYALICNGGVLLVEGREDREWYQESLSLVAPARKVMEQAAVILEGDKNRSLELRDIQGLFLFTKSSVPEEIVCTLKEELDLSKVDVFHNGVKVYVLPKELNKGRAVRRLQERLGGEMVIAAGDSEFDVSMLDYADYAIAPESLAYRGHEGKKVLIAGEEVLFSEKVLEAVLQIEIQKGWE